MSAIYFELRGKFFVGDVIDRNYDVISFISKYLLSRSKVATPAYIIKIVTMYTKITFKE